MIDAYFYISGATKHYVSCSVEGGSTELITWAGCWGKFREAAVCSCPATRFYSEGDAATLCSSRFQFGCCFPSWHFFLFLSSLPLPSSVPSLPPGSIPLLFAWVCRAILKEVTPSHSCTEAVPGETLGAATVLTIGWWEFWRGAQEEEGKITV